MTERDQIEAFTGEILKVVDRFRAEFQLPLASAAGALEIVKHSLVFNALAEDDDEETI